MLYPRGGWGVISLDREPGLAVILDIVSKCGEQQGVFHILLTVKRLGSLLGGKDGAGKPQSRHPKRLLWVLKLWQEYIVQLWSCQENHFIHTGTLFFGASTGKN